MITRFNYLMSLMCDFEDRYHGNFCIIQERDKYIAELEAKDLGGQLLGEGPSEEEALMDLFCKLWAQSWNMCSEGAKA